MTNDPEGHARRIRGLCREGGGPSPGSPRTSTPTTWATKRDALADAYMRRLDADWGEQAARFVVAFAAENGVEVEDDLDATDRTFAAHVLAALIEADARSRQSTRALQQDRGPHVRSG